MSNTMSNQITVKKGDIRAILAVTFPEYRGRKFSIRLSHEYQMADYWDGGSRKFVKAVMALPSCYRGKTYVDQVCWMSLVKNGAAGVPWNAVSNAKITVPMDAILVEHEIFYGGDMGSR